MELPCFVARPRRERKRRAFAYGVLNIWVTLPLGQQRKGIKNVGGYI